MYVVLQHTTVWYYRSTTYSVLFFILEYTGISVEISTHWFIGQAGTNVTSHYGIVVHMYSITGTMNYYVCTRDFPSGENASCCRRAWHRRV